MGTFNSAVISAVLELLPLELKSSAERYSASSVILGNASANWDLTSFLDIFSSIKIFLYWVFI